MTVGTPLSNGTPAGVTVPDAVDTSDVPIEFVAVTVNVYSVPLVRPVTWQPVVAVVHDRPPGLEVTV